MKPIAGKQIEAELARLMQLADGRLNLTLARRQDLEHAIRDSLETAASLAAMLRPLIQDDASANYASGLVRVVGILAASEVLPGERLLVDVMTGRET